MYITALAKRSTRISAPSPYALAGFHMGALTDKHLFYPAADSRSNRNGPRFYCAAPLERRVAMTGTQIFENNGRAGQTLPTLIQINNTRPGINQSSNFGTVIDG